jgi:hypothetical protein
MGLFARPPPYAHFSTHLESWKVAYPIEKA